VADNQWVNRTELKSETSNRVYVVAQHAVKRFWGCSCPGWRRHRHCKHPERLDLPSGEEPCEVDEEHAKARGFLDGYRTYDAKTGRGSTAGWRRAFAGRMGLTEARQTLGLSAAAGWDDVRRASHPAATENLTRLASEFETAVQRFDGAGDVAAKAAAVRAAKFRLEADAAYLADQRQTLDAEAGRITGLLLDRIETL
jgi:hypothetical protein